MTTLNDYCRAVFGKKLYKLSLDGGCSCPNRDGRLDTRGCVFCSAGGSGEFTGKGRTLDEQIEDAKRRVAAKNKNGGYIAYFQSFTNTYAPTPVLRERFLPVINRPDIDVLDVATRRHQNSVFRILHSALFIYDHTQRLLPGGIRQKTL